MIITSPTGVVISVVTIASVIMEASSPFTRRRGLKASSAIQAAVQSFFDREVIVFVPHFTTFVLWISLERSWLSFLSVSAYNGYFFY